MISEHMQLQTQAAAMVQCNQQMCSLHVCMVHHAHVTPVPWSAYMSYVHHEACFRSYINALLA